MNLPQEIHLSFIILKCISLFYFTLSITVLQTAAWNNSRVYSRLLKHNAKLYFIFFREENSLDSSCGINCTNYFHINMNKCVWVFFKTYFLSLYTERVRNFSQEAWKNQKHIHNNLETALKYFFSSYSKIFKKHSI